MAEHLNALVIRRASQAFSNGDIETLKRLTDNKMKKVLLLAALLLAPAAYGQDKPARLGEIEFYGYAGLDINRIREATLLWEGKEFSTPEAMFEAIGQLKAAVEWATGHPPTDVSVVCCDDHGEQMVFVGLQGRSSRRIAYHPAPKGKIRLPSQVMDLYRQSMDAVMEAVRLGKADEDDSRGYALAGYPALRAKQLATREYALRHEGLVRRVLKSSQDARQREVAAHVLGYARRSKAQIAALAYASRDENEGVRNNAVRALGVLARSDPKVAAEVPAADFVDMLNSGHWEDRNKGGMLVEALSAGRDPQLLGRLRSQALESLLEMARWRSSGHARSARVLLGRVAGIEEGRLQHLLQTGQVEAIFKALEGR